jgi:anion-transporting  ArsA/GET3 family ATPase
VKELLRKGSVVILLGTGGVGKTTIAAALGIAAAAHFNTALITVDPAKRLRDALGLKRLGGRPKGLGAARLKAAGLDPDLALSAMVLDVKGAWDSLVDRFASDNETRKRILENPFYHSLTEQFAGSEAFAALEQLYDLHGAREFEIEIVDTPPAAHAFEFLQAPARLARLLDSRAARWLFRPYLSAGKLAARLASRAAKFVVRELERFAGATVLSSIADFFSAAADAVDQVVDRLHKTEALLHSPEVRFILVTTAEQDRLDQARELISEMKTEGLRLSAIVLNRFLDEAALAEIAKRPASLPQHLNEIGSIGAILSGDSAENGGVRAIADFLESYRVRALGDIHRVARFARELPPDVELVIAPEIRIGVSDLEALAHLADLLERGEAASKLVQGITEQPGVSL